MIDVKILNPYHLHYGEWNVQASAKIGTREFSIQAMTMPGYCGCMQLYETIEMHTLLKSKNTFDAIFEKIEELGKKNNFSLISYQTNDIRCKNLLIELGWECILERKNYRTNNIVHFMVKEI